jgi:hypothetical protein
MAKKKYRKKRKGMKRLSQPGYALSRRGKGGKVRKQKRKKRGFLSEAGITDYGKTAGSGLIGGGITGIVNDMIPDDWNFFYRTVINGVVSYGAHRAGFKNVSAGIAGAYGLLGYMKLRSGNLQEDHPYADEEVLSEYPMFCDDNGNPMALAEDGNMYYLDENGDMIVDPMDELFSAANPFSLSESIYPGGRMYQD